ncbi:biogenesis of lysosome-related organelles complex 1 subunit 3 isoform X1 [Schistocerca cancellata]|uniref:biogenesis of lysosome-related organelles complex 1 subunit 3 isoform X1 n=1 Tax=Schistocerca cancellata TaxID=274614 RepID=UPI002119B165|nr:biogenesis of lysosome-related organelles complex 1 subunit 3 isoform X1 [Schistocerca cancellata]XP_049783901.1 biogenesis of lysosome-related organelles complex 1 subunit 3 isoform X1 [Schistocerca cancellata]XP_049783902.1 biogenesis of lysosome-related organelles complex 1 subunit 3 isoform X1 [Schistocerca cancellata]
MEKKPYIVSGEAPESDSGGEEFAVSDAPFQQTGTSSASNLQGIIVAGEAPESDEEREEPGSVSSISSAASVSSETSLTTNVKKGYKGKKSESKYSSLLHKKLRERNISLYKNISEFAYSTLTSAGRDLNLTNQQLLRSQVQLQEAATSLHILQSHLTQLHTKIAAVSTSAFIPQIYVQQCEQE